LLQTRAAKWLKGTALFLAATLWLVQMFGHGRGGKIAAWAFQTLGQQRGEMYCVIGVSSIFLLAFAWLGRRIWQSAQLDADKRALARAELQLWLARGFIWVLVALLAERALVALRSELYHYVQYATITFLIYSALRRPAVVMVLGTLLGMVDELHQLITLYHEHPSISFDWNDALLNLIGSSGGVLVGLLVFKSPEQNKVNRPLLLFCALGALAGALCYEIPWRRFWTVWALADNSERYYHQCGFGEGLLMLSAALSAFILLFSQRFKGRMALVFLMAAMALGPPCISYRFAPRVKDPPLPHAYVVQRSDPIIIDGKLDEETWRRASVLWIRSNRMNKGIDINTKFYLTWDSKNLYLAFSVYDFDILGRKRQRDDPNLPAGEVVEMFLDPNGKGKEYLEIEINPAGAIYDLIVKNQVPIPGEPYSWFQGDPSWDAEGLEKAIHVEGTLGSAKSLLDNDKMWTVEIKIPFSALPASMSPPSSETRWRANFYRIDRPRGKNGEYSCWSPSMSPSFHQVQRFGTLIFSSKRGKLRKKL
jgi:VanZ family protein